MLKQQGQQGRLANTTFLFMESSANNLLIGVSEALQMFAVNIQLQLFWKLRNLP